MSGIPTASNSKKHLSVYLIEIVGGSLPLITDSFQTRDYFI